MTSTHSELPSYTISNPYTNTTLKCDVRVSPKYFDNEIIEWTKNLAQKMNANKCFRNLGYVSKIYDVYLQNSSDALIVEGDPREKVEITVNFTCRLVNVFVGNYYVAKIFNIINNMILSVNGPIIFVTFSNDINSENIVYSHHKQGYFPKNKETGAIDLGAQITKDITYVVVHVITKKYKHKQGQIIAFAKIENIATDENIRQNIDFEFGNNEKNKLNVTADSNED